MRLLRVFILTTLIILLMQSLALSHGRMDYPKLKSVYESLPKTKFRDAIRKEYISDVDRDKFLEMVDDDAERLLLRIIINTYRVNRR